MKYFIVEVCNGLCNRLRAIASGWILANKLNRTFRLRWDPNKDIGGTHFQKLFKNEDLEISDKEYKRLSIRAGVHTSQRLKTEIALMGEICLDESQVIILKKTGGNYRHPNMTLKEYNTLKSQFYNMLEPVEAVQKRIEIFSEKHNLDECIGVQIRRKDRKHITPPTETFGRYLSRLEDRFFFLCSDDRNEIQNLKKYTNSKVLIIAYPKMEYSTNTVMCIQEALVEWKLLSMCKSIVYSQSSSFGYESCIPNKLVNSKELRTKRERSDNEKRNLPPLIFM